MITKELEQDLIDKKIWQPSCPIHFNRMKVLDVKYLGFDNETKIGRLMILDVIAHTVGKIFDELYAVGFKIEKIELINKYNGSDRASMEANNSSGFNCRPITGTPRFSLHSYGTAIDINPGQNPYIYTDSESVQHVEPTRSNDYMDRNNIRLGMITEDAIAIFAQYGFDWGGNWKKPTDYHHFQLARKFSERLAALDYEAGVVLWSKYLDEVEL